MDADTLSDVEGALAGIALRDRLAGEAETVRDGAALGLRFHKPLAMSWPREASVSVEVMTLTFGAAAVLAARLIRPGETHMAYLLGHDTERDAADVAAAGYDPCWTTQLLTRSLDDHDDGPAGFDIEPLTAATLAELNAAGASPPLYPAALEDDHIIPLVACRDGRALATGMIIHGFSDAAYVADMWTHPDARRQGAGRAIIAALHGAARKVGARRSVLYPSLMAVQIGFYRALGYTPRLPAAVLLSKP